MDVTVSIPRALQSACEGRASIVLGVPVNTSVVEVLSTVLALYPGLMRQVASDKTSARLHFSVAAVGNVVILFAQGIGA